MPAAARCSERRRRPCRGRRWSPVRPRRCSWSAGRRRSPRRWPRPTAPAPGRSPAPVATSAASRSGWTSRSARLRTLNWMLKSTPSPTNSGMKATEMRLKRPVASRPMAAVRTRPISVVHEDRQHDARRAHRQPQDAQQRDDHRAAGSGAHPRPAYANSSSASGTGPVSRTTDAVRRIQPQRSGRRADGLARAPPGLQLPRSPSPAGPA